MPSSLRLPALEAIEAERERRDEQLAKVRHEQNRERVEASRGDFLEFVKYVRPRYQANWHHEMLCRKLDRFARGLIKRLMVFMPPRHGKSELVSRCLPPYLLGRDPDLSIIATSYGADLAQLMNRDCQRIIDSPAYADVFPETRLNSANIRTVSGSWLRNSDLFEVVGHHGVYRCAGVGGGITGMGGNVIIVDDPIKNRDEANSRTYRDKLWEWYASTLYTRLQGEPSAILLTVTRWHEDDLAGRLLEQARSNPEADQWEVVLCEAIKEGPPKDYDTRKEGEALWPGRYPLEKLARTRATVTASTWSALYQQRPSPAEGSILKRAHWQYFKPPLDLRTAPVDELRKALGIERIVQSWDTAHTEKKQNDLNSCVTFGVAKNRYLLLDVTTERMEYPALKRAVRAKYDRWHPEAVLVEDKAAGMPLVQDLRQGSRIPLVLVTPVGDKISRANAVAASHEAELFWLPEGAAWVDAFVESCATFPNAPHDDDVDAFTQGGNYLIRKGQRFGDIQLPLEAGLRPAGWNDILGGTGEVAPHLGGGE